MILHFDEKNYSADDKVKVYLLRKLWMKSKLKRADQSLQIPRKFYLPNQCTLNDMLIRDIWIDNPKQIKSFLLRCTWCLQMTYKKNYNTSSGSLVKNVTCLLDTVAVAISTSKVDATKIGFEQAKYKRLLSLHNLENTDTK